MWMRLTWEADIYVVGNRLDRWMKTYTWYFKANPGVREQNVILEA